MELCGIDEEVVFGDCLDNTLPSSLAASAPVMDMAFHPNLPLLALGLVSGEVEMYEHKHGEMMKKALQNDFASWVFGRGSMYDENDVVINYSNANMRMHPYGAVSSLEFTDDGSYLVSASSDKTISVVDCATSKLVIHITAESLSKVKGSIKKKNTTTNEKIRIINKNTNLLTSSEEIKRQKVGANEAVDNNNNVTHNVESNFNHSNNSGVDNIHNETQHVHDAVRVNIESELHSATRPAKRANFKKVIKRISVNPHKHGISALNVCDENLVATGDDDGFIAIWDMRLRKPVHTYHEHADYISQLCYFTDAQELLSSSGDTCLGVYDLRKGEVRDVSEKRKDEINCFAFINSSGTQGSSFIPSVICGTPSGSLPIWKYGSWSRPYNIMERHPRECESIISFNNDTSSFNHNIILTGAVDGLVRVIQMYPLRRHLCQLSARDYDYAHANSYYHDKSSSTAITTDNNNNNDDNNNVNKKKASSLSSSMLRGGMSNPIVQRQRGQQAITRMRVNFDCSLLAVAGNDNIIDFVDVKFLTDEKQLDELRNARERRHMEVIREMEYEAAENEVREQRYKEQEEEEQEHECNEKDNASSEEEEDSDDDSDSSSSSNNDSNSDSDDDVSCQRDSSKTEKMKTSIRSKFDKKKESSGKMSEEEIASQAKAAMDAYHLTRQKKRERVAATKWLKEEKRKKINFTYEKRRRRVGGFFGDLVE